MSKYIQIFFSYADNAVYRKSELRIAWHGHPVSAADYHFGQSGFSEAHLKKSSKISTASPMQSL